MAHFEESFIADLKERATLSEFVGRAVALKASGQSAKGLCPFHSEKTPSFHVYDRRGFFHCFGCGTGGDVFKFLMLHERLSFPEAVRRVAESLGVSLPRSFRTPADDRRARLTAVNDAALRFYRRELGEPRGQGARAYAERRGIEPATMERFEVGYAPAGWDNLLKGLRQEGIGQAELVEAGLCIERPRGPGAYDRFRDRLMFPIRSEGGSLIAFGGRALGDDPAKYLNSPETTLYSKGDVLYALDKARGAIHERGRCLVVEGYMDVVMLQQAGFEEAVATLGTSLTPGHARVLKRHAPLILLCYDADAAGRRAAARALQVFLPAGLDVALVTLEAGLDPDDYVRAHGREAFERRLAEAMPFVDFLVGEAAPADQAGRARLGREVLETIAAVQDPVARRLHVARLAEHLRVEDALLLGELERLRKGPGRQEPAPPEPRESSERAVGPHTLAEALLVRCLYGSEPWVADVASALLDRELGAHALGGALEKLARLARDGSERPLDGGLEELVGGPLASRVRGLLGDARPVSEAEARGALVPLERSELERRLAEIQARVRASDPAQEGHDELLMEKMQVAGRLRRLSEAGRELDRDAGRQ